ncbi:MAG TPA: glycine zipper 2TM domain-containing protein [Phenylobacterium sp.]|nr:glycine zipper 2TM domain-containing protein [Phenylobacterium sp.]
MKTFLKMGAVSSLALAMAMPAGAQTAYRPTDEYQRQQQDYDYQRQQYEQQQQQYQDSRDRYRNQRLSYADARRAYDQRLADWERARADYDARYGYGAYVRYHPRPVWNEAYYMGPPRYSNDTSRYSYDASRYGYDASATTVPCNNNAAVGGGVIGAIAGAVLGSNIAARNARPEGAIVGGVLGAAAGSAIGHAHDRYKCDRRGPYFSYRETIPYREGGERFASRYDYDWYRDHRCRLAAAPVDPDGRDIRYVRVCPDSDGRYRITG